MIRIRGVYGSGSGSGSNRPGIGGPRLTVMNNWSWILPMKEARWFRPQFGTPVSRFQPLEQLIFVFLFFFFKF